jgi:hypothetical protein
LCPATAATVPPCPTDIAHAEEAEAEASEGGGTRAPAAAACLCRTSYKVTNPELVVAQSRHGPLEEEDEGWYLRSVTTEEEEEEAGEIGCAAGKVDTT